MLFKRKLERFFGIFGVVLYNLFCLAIVALPLIIIKPNIWITLIALAIIIFIDGLGDLVQLILWSWSFTIAFKMPVSSLTIAYWIVFAVYVLMLTWQIVTFLIAYIQKDSEKGSRQESGFNPAPKSIPVITYSSLSGIEQKSVPTTHLPPNYKDFINRQGILHVFIKPGENPKDRIVLMTEFRWKIAVNADLKRNRTTPSRKRWYAILSAAAIIVVVTIAVFIAYNAGLNNAAPVNTTNGLATVYVTASDHKYHLMGCQLLGTDYTKTTISNARKSKNKPCSKCNPDRLPQKNKTTAKSSSVISNAAPTTSGNLCSYPDCTKDRKFGSLYCHTHSCLKSGCPQPKSNTYSSYCSDHECQYPDCTNSRKEGSNYCYQHTCTEISCHNERANNLTFYCTEHKCHYPGCNSGASINSLYCFIHK